MLGIVGVTGATCGALSVVPTSSLPLALGAIAAGGAAGAKIGSSVQPMALPQTVAGFHSLVGIAATITSIASFMAHPDAGTGHRLAAVLGDSIGAITFTGSLVAFAKLDGRLSSKPLNLPAKNLLNIGMAGSQVAMAGAFLGADYATGLGLLWGSAGLSSVLGAHLVGSVGGGDMPVCITVLNSYSGWALVAEGFMLDSPTLTVVGSLIGFSGAILTKIMCDGMNRDIGNVIFGGYATTAAAAKDDGPKEHVETNVDAVANLLAGSSKVVIVPGYGMAVARAQYATSGIANQLQEKGIDVAFGIHPVAGRMPGQMNVLLAEAGTPYEWVHEMEEVNPHMEETDVCLIVGANDITNSAAQEVEGCSIWGMPVIEVWKAKNVVFMKRTMAGGYADLDNPVFYKENTQMFLGDAKDKTEALNAALKDVLK